MTSDAELLTFAVKWLPFGGAPAEDVFVTYGLTYSQFTRRLADALIHERGRVPPATATALARIYRLNSV